MKYLQAFAAAVTFFALGTTSEVLAQYPGQARYMPATPTLSPYLQLARPNFGGVPNYYTFVRPMERQQAINQQNQAAIVQQQRQIQTLDSDVRMQGSMAPPTGIQSSYMDYSHYYPTRTPPGQRR